MKLPQLGVALVCLTLALSCGARADDDLIVPGISIGKMRLGSDGADQLSGLPKPAAIDAGMSQTRQVWVENNGGSKDTLFVHTTANGATDAKPVDGVTIDLIRVTASYFRTRTELRTGSTLGQVLLVYPDCRPLDDENRIYDDSKQGIAFEFDPHPNFRSPCIAIMIHPAGRPNYATQEQVQSILDSGASGG
jgi:hypothetical protein